MPSIAVADPQPISRFSFYAHMGARRLPLKSFAKGLQFIVIPQLLFSLLICVSALACANG
jgi:hypothetical protein